MSASTVHNTPSSGSPTPGSTDGGAKFVTQKTDIMELWLSGIPQAQQHEAEDEDTRSRSTSADVSDDRVIMALGHLIVADEFGNVVTSRRDLPMLGGPRRELGYITDDCSSSADEDVLLQSVLLESMASANQEKTQRYLEEKTAVLTAVDPRVAVLTQSWADIETDDEENDSSDDNGVSEILAAANKSHVAREVQIDNCREQCSFDCPWTAWYDPPKGRGARLGIARDVYEKKLFEMGVILCPEEFWTVHEMVDWDNMPCGSMVSFSRIGSKPFWEDPMHHAGGRWIIRGFPRALSESLFTKIALSLFLGHFPDSHEFTCVTLQVKEKKRPNAIQLWTRNLYYDHIEEIQEHICCFLENEEFDGDSQQRGRGNRRRRGRKSSGSIPERLQFEFCPNSESIERNAFKLGGIVAVVPSTRRSRRSRKAAEMTLASRCNEVSEMYSRKKSKDVKSSKKGGRQKVDWSDSLLQMGYGRYSSRGEKAENEASIATSRPSVLEGIVPEKEVQGAERSGQIATSEERPIALSDPSLSMPNRDTWRSMDPSTADNRRSQKLQRKTLKGVDPDLDSWRHKKSEPDEKTSFREPFDIKGLAANGEDPVFIEFDPNELRLIPSNESGNPDYPHYYGCRPVGGDWVPSYSGFTSPACGTFDSHGCWYPPATPSEAIFRTDEDLESTTAWPNTLKIDSTALPQVAGTAVRDGLQPEIEVSDNSVLCSGDCNNANDLAQNGTKSSAESACFSQEEWQHWCPPSQQWWTPECGYCSQPFYYPEAHPYMDPSTFYLTQHSSEISRLADSVAEQSRP